MIGTLYQSLIHHKKNQRIENWISKVNECAKIYNWTDEQTAHFSLPKLGGNAKKSGMRAYLLFC